MKASGELNRDPALTGYVRGVACKVAGGHCGDIRVYVMDRPFLNAQMAPNGYMEVWSGLLLRATDEAELAFVLGHETTHFIENHTVERLRALKTRANTMLALQIGIAVVGVAAAAGTADPNSAQSILNATSNLSDVVYLAVLASYFSYNRDQEIEADKQGFDRAVAAGYDATAGGDIWRAQIAEAKASDFDRVRKSEARGSIFNTHPLSADRIAALDARAKTAGGAGDRGRERFRAAIRPHLIDWLRDDLRRRDYGQTLFLIDRLAANGEDLGVLNYFRGEAYRLRRKDGDLAKAQGAYMAASAQPDAPAATWREIGDLRRRDNDKAGARAAYEIYLAKAPEAQDAWMVKDALSEMQ